MAETKRTEESLAAHAMAYWQADGWEMFPEVQMGSYGRRADMVGRRYGNIVVIECKQSLTFDVMAQARLWWAWAHVSYVAVWEQIKRSGRLSGRDMAYRVCEGLGIGVVEFDDGGSGKRVSPARLNRKPQDGLARILNDGHKKVAPGNARSDYWSPFRQTCEEARRKLIENGGHMTLKDLMTSIQHHYASDASARGAFAGAIDSGFVPGLALERTGRMLVVRILENDAIPGGGL